MIKIFIQHKQNIFFNLFHLSLSKGTPKQTNSNHLNSVFLGEIQMKQVYTQMNSKIGFWLRQLGSKFLVFTRALLSSNGRSLQTQKFAPLTRQISNF